MPQTNIGACMAALVSLWLMPPATGSADSGWDSLWQVSGVICGGLRVGAVGLRLPGACSQQVVRELGRIREGQPLGGVHNLHSRHHT
jgi:hypothetical protein